MSHRTETMLSKKSTNLSGHSFTRVAFIFGEWTGHLALCESRMF